MAVVGEWERVGGGARAVASGRLERRAAGPPEGLGWRPGPARRVPVSAAEGEERAGRLVRAAGAKTSAAPLGPVPGPMAPGTGPARRVPVAEQQVEKVAEDAVAGRVTRARSCAGSAGRRA